MSAPLFTLVPMRGMPKVGHFGPFFDVETDPNPASAETVLTRYSGSAVKMAERVTELEKDNYKQRDEIRGYKDTIKTLEGKVPPDGSVVLAKDDAALLDAYRAIGKPDELTTRLTNADAATQERDTLKREKTLRQVADDTGIKPGALATVDKLYGGLTYEVKTTKAMVNGKQVDVKQVMVKRDEKDVALVDLVKQDYPEIAAILTAETAPPARDGTPTRDRPKPAPLDPTQTQGMQAPTIRL